jgi:hypothetical protein
MSDSQFEYERLCYAVKKMIAAQEDAENNRNIQTKKLLASKLKREVIELLNPEKRLVTQSVINWERK